MKITEKHEEPACTVIGVNKVMKNIERTLHKFVCSGRKKKERKKTCLIEEITDDLNEIRVLWMQ